MMLIPAGHFQMGDSFGEGGASELPIHSVHVSAFYMDRCEVTKELWDDVSHWATNHGYIFRHHAQGKAPGHPAHSLDWHDALLWCNARSEKEGRVPAYYTDSSLNSVYRSGAFIGGNESVKWDAGYRLPTEAEWEKAARGGAIGRRFAWADTDTISHSQANYFSPKLQAYDLAATDGFHPGFYTGALPYTSPAGYFNANANGYGLYDMSGNIAEWCWDGYASYSGDAQADPRGPNDQSIAYRVVRGGAWDYYPVASRVAMRLGNRGPATAATVIGFRTILPGSQ
jgi:formylglycine-generating enzyme required for sulfatase activity